MIAGFEDVSSGAIRAGDKAIHEPAAQGSRRRHGVRGLRALPAADHPRQYRLRPAARAAAARGGDRAGRPRSPSCSRSSDILDRYPPTISAGQQQRTSLARALIRRRRRLAARRADVPARAAAAGDPARTDQGLSDRAQDDDRVRHPRPDRGDRAGGPDRGHGAGHPAAIRAAGGAEGAAGQPVRRELHRRAADEHRRRAAGRQPDELLALDPAGQPAFQASRWHGRWRQPRRRSSWASGRIASWWATRRACRPR